MTHRRLIFITGASRSGTTLLSFVLRNHREVFGLKELHYFGQAWDPRQSQRRFSRNEAVEAAAAMFACQEHGVLAPKISPAHRHAAGILVDGLGDGSSDPAVVFAATVHKLAHAAGKTIPCEQTPRYVFYARALLERYPSAHVVHIVRDPRAVMASQKKRWQRRRLAADRVAVPRYQSLRVWVNYHPFTVARLWSRATSEALALADHPRMSVVRFEDLVRDPEATVRQLCGRLDLEFDDRMLDVGQINSSHQSSAGGGRRGLHADAIETWKTSLTATEIAITEQRCGALMRRFGYGITGEPGSRASWAGFRLSYLAHLGGVLLVNPRRAWVQGRALLNSRAHAIQPLATRRKVDVQGDLAE